MMKNTNELKIAILATEGFEEVELTGPCEAMDEAGVSYDIISPKSGSIRAWNHTEWSDDYQVDVELKNANSGDYDGLFLPGGVLNPDQLRMNTNAIQFINEFIDAGKPIAAICHGPQLLIETGRLKGRKMTSYPSVKTDIINAGAEWVDEEVVVDAGLVTSRKPDDIPAFNRKMLEEFSEGVHKSMAQ